MLKLSASAMKKVPTDGLDYSSRSCSAGIEVELPSGSKADEIRCRLKQLCAVLEIAVDEQLGNPRPIPDQGRAASTLASETYGQAIYSPFLPDAP